MSFKLPNALQDLSPAYVQWDDNHEGHQNRKGGWSHGFIEVAYKGGNLYAANLLKDNHGCYRLEFEASTPEKLSLDLVSAMSYLTENGT